MSEAITPSDESMAKYKLLQIQSAFDIVAKLGLSRRDYFAAAALNGWAAGRNNGDAFGQTDTSNPTLVAQGCVNYADALLRELEKKV